MVRLGLDADFSAHALDGSTDDREADAGPFVRAVRMEALENSEDAFVGAAVNANAECPMTNSSRMRFEDSGPSPEWCTACSFRT